MNEKNIVVYLNNHLAGSLAGTEFARKCLSESRGSLLGNFLEKLVAELEEDQEAVRKLLARLGGHEDTFKKMGAWALEKLSEVKIADYTNRDPHLLRLVELEGLLLGNRGRLAMWQVLYCYLGDDGRFDDLNIPMRVKRTEETVAELDRHRVSAGAPAFGCCPT